MEDIKHHIFCIEGQDNIGKTTLINQLADLYQNTYFTKYPTNSYNIKKCFKYVKLIKDQISNINIHEDTIYNDIKEQVFATITRYTIETMIYDMITKNEILNPSKDNKFIISDRGLLSTFLYQYREISSKNIYKSLIDFITKYYIIHLDDYNKSSINDLLLDNKISIHNILLYSSINLNLESCSLSEEEQYKKDFDNNKTLQKRINSDIKNLVLPITILNKKDYINNKEFHIKSLSFKKTHILNDILTEDDIKSTFSIIPINVFNEKENRRKTPQELRDEVSKFIDYYMKGNIKHEYI